MKPKHHFFVGLIVATISLFFSQDFPFISIELLGVKLTVFTICIAVSVLLDFDHVIDFRLNRHNWGTSQEQRFREGRMYVVFHSIENAIILTFSSLFFPFLIFPTISYICHIAMDAFGNNVSWYAYFYVFRFKRNWIKLKI